MTPLVFVSLAAMLHHVLLALVVIASISLLARSLKHLFVHLFVLAPLLGTTAALAGLAVSSALDRPSGPAIVMVSGLGFLAAWLWRARGRR